MQGSSVCRDLGNMFYRSSKLVQVTVPDALGPVAPEDYRSGYPPMQTMPVEYQGESTKRSLRESKLKVLSLCGR